MPSQKLIELETPVERASLVAVDTGAEDGWKAEYSLAELALTAGAEVVGAEWQNRRHLDPHWYVGKGKAEDLVGRQVRDRVRPALGPMTSCRRPSRRPSRGSVKGHRPQPTRVRSRRSRR